MPDRFRAIYVTADSTQWFILDLPHGLISPPTIDLHQPQVGAITFYFASCYRIEAPNEAGEEGVYEARPEEDIKATAAAEVLAITSGYGGEVIVASPRMEAMNAELTELVLSYRKPMMLL